jgi:hypothetical protein
MAELGGASQKTGAGIEAGRAVVVSRAKQADTGASGGGATGYIQRLRTGLGGNGDDQTRPAMQLLGQVDDKSGFTGARG